MVVMVVFTHTIEMRKGGAQEKHGRTWRIIWLKTQDLHLAKNQTKVTFPCRSLT